MATRPAPATPTTRKIAAPIARPVRRPALVSTRLFVGAAATGRRTRTTGTTTSSIGPVAAATTGGSSGAALTEDSDGGTETGTVSGVRNGIRQCGQRTTWPSMVSGTRAAA